MATIQEIGGAEKAAKRLTHEERTVLQLFSGDNPAKRKLTPKEIARLKGIKKREVYSILSRAMGRTPEPS
ncbi:MAG: hypothetical protein AAB655_00610 [Patescibacteria group bacterium]